VDTIRVRQNRLAGGHGCFRPSGSIRFAACLEITDPIPPSRRHSSRSSGRSRIAAWFQLESLCRSPSLVPPQIVPLFEKVSRVLPIKAGTAGSGSSLTRTFLSLPGHDLCENFRASRNANRPVGTSRRRLRGHKLPNGLHILP